MEHPYKVLLSLLKVPSMFNISIWYEANKVLKDVLDALEIKCIKCDKFLIMN